MEFKMKKAFTLAEVLITLGIIGVVAAMTLPLIIQRHKEKVYSAKLKKFYSIMENAGRLVENKYGSIDSWGLENSYIPDENSDADAVLSMRNSKDIFWDRYGEYINVISRDSMASPKTKAYVTYAMDGVTVLSSTLRNYVVLNDGTSVIGTWISVHSGPTYGDFAVDLNGLEHGPNAVGRDVFFFYITKNGIQPMGLQADTGRTFDGFCKYKGNGTYNGYGCTAWVIYNGNMDYLHCGDLSWDGTTKCK